MSEMAGLGIDDKHVLTCTADAVQETSPTLAQTLEALCRNPMDPTRLLREGLDLMDQVRPRLVLQSSSDYWLSTLGDDADDAFFLADKARRQVELLGTAKMVCTRLLERRPVTA